MKKLLSYILMTVVALSAVGSNTQAAITGTTSASAGLSGTTLTATLSANTVNGDIIQVSIKTISGSTVDISDATTFTAGVGAATIQSAYNTTGIQGSANGAGTTLSIIDTDLTGSGYFIVVINQTQNTIDTFTAYRSGGGYAEHEVRVTAVVLPYLTMQTSTGLISLGELSSSAYKTGALTVTGSTNAQGGMVISLASAGFKDTGSLVAGNLIGSGNTVAAYYPSHNPNSSGYYKVSTAYTGFDDVDNALGANNIPSSVAGSYMRESGINIYTSTGPVNPTATTVTIGAKSEALTPAGTYSDVLTLTATATF